jgi:HD-like signal output (HDOD) protein
MMNETTTDQAIVDPRTRRTIATLQDAMESGKSAAITQVIQLIQEITAKADTISVSQLADLVSRDLATMTKVLGVANTLGYNPVGAEITTVQQAIQTVGFEKIRNLAMALLLMESAERGEVGKQKQDVAALALASGIMAQAVSEHCPSIEPEQAFVCAALRSYGHLLIVNFLPEAYAQAKALTATMPWDAACREVFGLTTLELSYELLSSAQLAKGILSTIRAVPKELTESKFHSPSELLLIASDFSNRFCQHAAEKGVDGEQLKAEAARMAKQYGVALALDEDALSSLFERTEKRLQGFGQAHGLKMFSNPLMKRLANISTPKSIAKDKEAGLRPPVDTKSLRKLADGDLKFQELISQWGTSSGRAISLEEALTQVLQLLHDELKLAQSVVFLRDEILPTWSARLGRGSLFESIRGQSLLSLDSRNVFTICLSRGEDVLVQSPNEPSIRKYIPDWLKTKVEGNPLLLLSLRNGQETFGVICGIGNREQSIGLTSRLAEPLRALRKALAGMSRTEISP